MYWAVLHKASSNLSGIHSLRHWSWANPVLKAEQPRLCNAGSDLITSARPDCFFSLPALRSCRPIQEAATKLIRSAGPELIWSNMQLLHPNIQCILPYQPINSESTNSHPTTPVQFQKTRQKEKKITLRNIAVGHPNLVYYCKIGKYLMHGYNCNLTTQSYSLLPLYI